MWRHSKGWKRNVDIMDALAIDRDIVELLHVSRTQLEKYPHSLPSIRLWKSTSGKPRKKWIDNKLSGGGSLFPFGDNQEKSESTISGGGPGRGLFPFGNDTYRHYIDLLQTVEERCTQHGLLAHCSSLIFVAKALPGCPKE